MFNPGKKRFAVEDVRRVPVSIDATAKKLLDTSSHPGRLLPQALAELFGEEPDVERVEITGVSETLTEETMVVNRDHHHHEAARLHITVHHKDGAHKAHRYEIHPKVLVTFDEMNRPGYSVLHHVKGLREEYPHRTKDEYLFT